MEKSNAISKLQYGGVQHIATHVAAQVPMLASDKKLAIQKASLLTYYYTTPCHTLNRVSATEIDTLKAQLTVKRNETYMEKRAKVQHQKRMEHAKKKGQDPTKIKPYDAPKPIECFRVVSVKDDESTTTSQSDAVDHIELPRAFGIHKYGFPAECHLSKGRQMKAGLTMHPDFKLDEEGRQQVSATTRCLEQMKHYLGATLIAPVGSGKTQMGIFLMMQFKVKTLWMQHNGDLLVQSMERVKALVPGIRVGIWQGTKMDIENKDIVFCTVQTLFRRLYPTESKKKPAKKKPSKEKKPAKKKRKPSTEDEEDEEDEDDENEDDDSFVDNDEEENTDKSSNGDGSDNGDDDADGDNVKHIENAKPSKKRKAAKKAKAKPKTKPKVALSDDFFDNFGCLIVDECHHYAAHTFASVNQKIRTMWKLGLSATPQRNDGLEELIYWSIGPKVEIKVNRTIDAFVDMYQYEGRYQELNITKLRAATSSSSSKAFSVWNINRLPDSANRLTNNSAKITFKTSHGANPTNQNSNAKSFEALRAIELQHAQTLEYFCTTFPHLKASLEWRQSDPKLRREIRLFGSNNPDAPLNEAKMMKNLIDDPVRNTWIVKKLVQLWLYAPHRRTLILSLRVEHCNLLRTMFVASLDKLANGFLVRSITDAIHTYGMNSGDISKLTSLIREYTNWSCEPDTSLYHSEENRKRKRKPKPKKIKIEEKDYEKTKTTKSKKKKEIESAALEPAVLSSIVPDMTPLERRNIFATVSIAAEGLDLKTHNTLLFALPPCNVIQCCGRIMREAYIIDKRDPKLSLALPLEFSSATIHTTNPLILNAINNSINKSIKTTSTSLSTTNVATTPSGVVKLPTALAINFGQQQKKVDIPQPKVDTPMNALTNTPPPAKPRINFGQTSNLSSSAKSSLPAANAPLLAVPKLPQVLQVEPSVSNHLTVRELSGNPLVIDIADGFSSFYGRALKREKIYKEKQFILSSRKCLDSTFLY